MVLWHVRIWIEACMPIVLLQVNDSEWFVLTFLGSHLFWFVLWMPCGLPMLPTLKCVILGDESPYYTATGSAAEGIFILSHVGASIATITSNITSYFNQRSLCASLWHDVCMYRTLSHNNESINLSKAHSLPASVSMSQDVQRFLSEYILPCTS